MSTIKAQVEDPRINEIRNSVAQHTDSIPFLLLPVRTETRFMQVEKKSLQVTATIESVLEGMAFVQIEAINTQGNLTGDNIRSLTTDTTGLITPIQQLGIISIKEKGWLKQLFNDMQKDLQIVVTLSQNTFTPDSQKLNSTITQLSAAVSGVKIIDLSALQPASGLVSAFASLDDTLQTLNAVNKKRTPYTDIKNKKSLYIYITKTVNDVKAFYQNADAKVKALQYIDKAQRARIQQLQQDIQNLLNTTIASIAKIHPDASWKKFVQETVTPLVTEIINLSNAFTASSLPLLNKLPEPPARETGDIYFSGIKALIKINRFNLDKKQGYDIMKRYKKYIDPHIASLTKTIASPINESAAGQSETLQHLFASINTELQKSITRINNYNAINKSQTAGKTIISNYFGENVSNVIGGFAGIGNFPKPVYVPAAPQLVNQLWVRIYPDDIFVMTHEEALTDAETQAGKQFWKTWWAAGGDNDLQMGAWQTLCTALGNHRASWVARVLNPNANAQNLTALQANPSAKIIDAINITDATNATFKKLPLDKSASEIVNAAVSMHIMNGLHVNFSKIESELSSLNFEQDYLLDKFKSHFINTMAIISALINKCKALLSHHQPNIILFIQNLQTLVNLANKIQTAFNKITPVNHKDFVDKITDPFVYPSLTPKDGDWTTAPHTTCLPDRFVVITMKGEQFTRIAVGNPIDETLQLGLDPTRFNDLSIFTIDENGNLNIDENLKWMTDYDVAVSKGMGITLDITDDEYNNGFDRLIVLGVKTTDATNSKQLVEQLLTNHIYGVDGLSFLEVGTPTNNTHDVKSGWQQGDDTQQRYDIEIANKKYDASQTNVFNKADGKFLCDVLGIDNGVVQYANNATNFETANAYSANRALWGVSLGHYMEEMWDEMFTYDNIRRTENFFTNYCFARGVVPSLRVGMQPYGIITTTAFSQLQLFDTAMPSLTPQQAQSILPWGGLSPMNPLEKTLEQRFEMRLYNLLNLFKNTWTDLRNKNVIYSGNLNEEGTDPQQRFVQMLGLNATSLDYFYRYAINIAKGPNASSAGFSTNFKITDIFGPNGIAEIFKYQAFDGIFKPSFDFPDEDFAGLSWMLTDKKYSRILEQITSSRLFIARLVENSLPVTGNIIDTIPDSESLLKTDYLTWLLNANANDILGGNAVGDPNKIPFNTMLFVMLRQSLLQAYQEAALNILQSESLIDELSRRSYGDTNHYHYKMFQNGKYVNKYLTKWHFLFKNLSDLVADNALPSTVTVTPFYNFINTTTHSVANYLDRIKTNNPVLFNNNHKIFFDKLNNIRTAINTLKRANTNALDILMAEHIDLCTYRLDAWSLAFVVKRLQEQRTTQASGLFLGAYGYVEDLRRDTGKKSFKDADTLSNFKLDANKPVYHDDSNMGFIHGPSIGQAIAAAVLRNAYMTNNLSSEDVANRLAVNISSSRVRMALQLIEGIRNGQELGAILGFQFERGLHDKYKTMELDKYIQPLRKAFPLQQKVDETANGEPTYISLVVNGAAILDKVHAAVDWPSNPAIKDETIGDLLRANNYSKFPKEISDVIDANLFGDDKFKTYNLIVEEIDRMADAFDALGDLAISESVYQMVMGNHVRASAMLTALAEGKNIPEAQIIDTPRNGLVVTQRVILNFAAITDLTTIAAGWGSVPTIRSMTEPSFNNWLGATLGAASAIKYVLTKKNNNNIVTKISSSISNINLQPIDLFLIPGAENELQEIIINLYRKNSNDFTSAISIDIKERDDAWTTDDRSISETYILINHIRNMISNAKYAGDNDLRLPVDVMNPDNVGNWDADELNKRVNGAYKSLQVWIQGVEAESFLTNILNGTTHVEDAVVTVAEINTMFDHLDNALFLGIPHALSIPFNATATDAQRGTTVLQQMVNIYKQAVLRESDATAAINAMASVTSAKLKVQKLIELAKIVLGKNAIVNPLYTPLSITTIQTELNLTPDKRITRYGSSVVVEDWIQNVAKVRERINDLSMVMETSDMFNLSSINADVAQLPYTDGDYWLGIEYPTTYTPSGDSVSLILVNPQQLKVSGAQSGFVIDEWLEIIPTKEQTTGITFNYNNPNASPPQSLLLAVTPQITNQWAWDDLVYTIVDTMEMAKNRAVEPDHFDNTYLSQVLPGVFSEVVPPQFRNEDVNPLGVQVVMDFADVKKPAVS